MGTTAVSAPSGSWADRLATIPSADPSEIRHHVSRTLREAVSCELAFFSDCVEAEGGRLLVPSAFDGDLELTRSLEGFGTFPAEGTPWLRPHVDASILDRFVAIRSHYDHAWLESMAIQRHLFLPLAVWDQLRAVMFDDDRFLGWIGLLRQGDARDAFRPNEVRTLRRVTPLVRAALATARDAEPGELAAGVAAVFTPTGRLAHASPGFARWAVGARRDVVARRCRELEAGRGHGRVLWVDGAEVRFLRLDGREGVRLLVTVSPAALYRLRPVDRLSPRQREVAEYAAAGATNEEVARALGIGAETVKTHLRTVYERLGVANRAELVTTLRD